MLLVVYGWKRCANLDWLSFIKLRLRVNWQMLVLLCLTKKIPDFNFQIRNSDRHRVEFLVCIKPKKAHTDHNTCSPLREAWFLLDPSASPDPWALLLVPSALTWPGLAPFPCLVPGLRAAADSRSPEWRQAARASPQMSAPVVGAGFSVLWPRPLEDLDRSAVPILQGLQWGPERGPRTRTWRSLSKQRA